MTATTLSQYESNKNTSSEFEEMDTSKMSLMEKAQYLVKKKDFMEKEIKDWQEVLESHKVGMNDSLLDSEGFPRSDIDIVQIRIARNKIIYLKNDYKAIMNEIEKALYDLHKENQLQKEKQNENQNISKLRPFAIVNSVSEFSPAYEAGLLAQDKIVEFGPINENNNNNLKALPEIVMNNKDKQLPLVVLRNQTRDVINLTLTPKVWSGRGLLGCHILPC